MGVRRRNAWRRLQDRSRYSYSKSPDDDLLAMKSVARQEAQMFLADGRGLFLEAHRLSGLSAINNELWKRGLTPAQQPVGDF